MENGSTKIELQILAARDVRLALVDLAKALGGGWDYETAVEPRTVGSAAAGAARGDPPSANGAPR